MSSLAPDARSGSRMRIAAWLAFTLGLTVAIWLIVAANAGAVLRVFAGMGPGLVAIVLTRTIIILGYALAWSRLLGGVATVPFRACLLLRWVREAVDILLPVASVGGELVGARLLTFWRVPGGIATASVLVDLLLQATAQTAFALLGLMLLASVVGVGAWGLQAAASVGLALLAIGGFYAVQRHGGLRYLDRLQTGLAARWSASAAQPVPALRLQEGLDAIWRHRRRLVQAVMLHFCCFMVGAVEVWIALRFTEHPTGFARALVLESLTNALRGAAFLVPGALGVQEGGFVGFGYLLGIAPDTALALSLAHRAPDILLGLPALLAWQWLELRNHVRAVRAKPTAEARR